MFYRVCVACSVIVVASSVVGASAKANEIKFGENGWTLSGTLTIPKSQKPIAAVVFVHGSGPLDRDETIGANKPFKDMAEGLAKHGIASLRYDKRTRLYPHKIKRLNDLTVQQETVADAVQAYGILAKQTKVNPEKIFVIGHSLGAMLAPRILKQEPHYAGAVMLAAPARSFGELLIEQTAFQLKTAKVPEAVAQQQMAAVKAQVAQIQDGKFAYGVPGTYWADLNAYDQVSVAEAIKRPLFIVQGDNDCQVSAKDDYPKWDKALSDHANVNLKLYPTLNHLLSPHKSQSTGAEYAIHTQVSKLLIDDIANWIETN